MKRLLFIPLIIVCLLPGFGQGSKFKKVYRTPADSAVSRSFAKDAQVIDGSINSQFRSGNDSSGLINSNVQATQLPSRINKNSVPSVNLKPVEQKPVVIERERTQAQLRSSILLSKEEMMYNFFRETPSLHINLPEKQIRIDKIDTDNLGMNHIRGVQLYRDYPIYGMEFTFHISPKSEFFMGYTLDTAFIDKSPAKLSAEEAIRIAEKDLSQTTKINQPGELMKKMLDYEHPSVGSIYYPDNFSVYRFCYKVIVRPNMKDEWIYYINAQNGTIVEKYNNTQIGANTGSGVDANGVTRTVNTYLEDGTHYMFNTTKSMYNPSDMSGVIRVYDVRNYRGFLSGEGSVYLASSTSSQWNNPNAISAMYHVSSFYDFIKQTFNRTSFDGKGADMDCFVNVVEDDGKGYENAFWNGKCIVLGNGNTIFSSLAGAYDIISHEFGHAIVTYTANLEYKNQSGAVNETYADIFGSMADRANWTIGENIIKNRSYFPSGALRDMSNPHNGGNGTQDPCWQPAHLSEMYLGSDDHGGVHTNCGITNYAYYIYASAVGKDKAEQTFFRALDKYLTSTSKFIDLRIATIQAAKDLHGASNAQVLANAFDSVGILDDTGSSTPTDLPTNPGQQGLLLISTDTSDRNTLYKTTDYKTFTPLTKTGMNSTAAITDDGKYTLFVDDKTYVRLLDMTTGNEGILINEPGFASVAISRDGSRIACITNDEDGYIYVYDFSVAKWASFRLYNPTTGTDGRKSYNVKYADAIEFDHTGEYLIYDACNSAGSSAFGTGDEYWDIGVINVWNNNKKAFGTGEIEKLFTMLEPGINVGNPTFSKNSPHIIAFDYFDTDATYAALGLNLLTGDLDIMFMNNFLSYPNYGMDDKTIAFTSFDDEDSYDFFTGYFRLGADKISTTGNGVGIAMSSAFPVYYGSGTRQLGLKPVAAFSSDKRSGSVALNVQFVDMSENSPTSWTWTFQGGNPSTSSQQHPKVTYNSNGTYPVKLVATNSYGSNEVTKQGYITVGVTGMEFVEQETFAIYPNPASDYILLKGIGGSFNDIKIFDITGRTFAFTYSNDNGAIHVDISHLPQGIYMLKVLLPEGKTLVQKFVKK